jgi:hypothetical protein
VSRAILAEANARRGDQCVTKQRSLLSRHAFVRDWTGWLFVIAGERIKKKA